MHSPVGILLINLGTPEATDFWPMRRYLREFLSDKRVIQASGPIWWLVLNGIILTRRPKKSGRAYARIWNSKLNESPLKTITRAQADAVAAQFSENPNIKIDWAMRYGKPAITAAVERMVSQGCQRILFFPLYPQYSAATTATAMDKVFEALKTVRHQPALRSVPPYYDQPEYIKALASSVRAHLNGLDWEPDVILASLHGLPVDFIRQGDPYQKQCEMTVELLRRELKLDGQGLQLAYQSRTSRAVWIGPDTEETLIRLARENKRRVLVIAPGFASDCVETLEEIEMRAAKVFKENGGVKFSYVPCLNDRPESVQLLINLIKRHVQNWD